MSFRENHDRLCRVLALVPFYAALLFISCAHPVPPLGGPPDTDPPEVVSTYPAPFTTHFSDNRIDIEFDEYVDKRTVEESIFISPYVGDLEFDWSGKEIEISFSERLRRNTTYVVNVGTDVKDLHNNRMAQAFTLAFSTGDDIDHGAIQGRVFVRNPDDSPEGIMVFAYQLENVNPDTLNPQNTKPDYITQTGKGGDFFFKHLAFGPYRIMAVRDEYRDLVYEPEADEYGVPFRDIRLTPTDTIASRIFMRLSKEDTTMPRLIKASARDRNHVILEFSENMDTSSFHAKDVAVTDTASFKQLPVISLFPMSGRPDAFTVVTEGQDSTKGYRIMIRAALDSAGNKINPIANSIGFSGSGQADTIGLRFSRATVKDSSRSVSVSPELQIFFTDAVRRQDHAELIVLKDSLSRTTPISSCWLNDASISVWPQRRLSSLMWFTLSISLRKLTDWRGEVARDTTRAIHFETMDADMLGGIEGFVSDVDSLASGKILLEVRSADRQKESSEIVLNQPGPFVFSDLKEGRYVLSAYRDANTNNRYDAGKPFPFSKAERFTVYPDTLKLRARWPLEGVKLDLR